MQQPHLWHLGNGDTTTISILLDYLLVFSYSTRGTLTTACESCMHVLDGMQAGGTEPPVVMCLLDNRGVGWSSSPAEKRDYSSTIMAKDTALVMVR